MLGKWINNDLARSASIITILLALALLGRARACPVMSAALTDTRDLGPNDLDLNGAWNDYYNQAQSGARDVWLRSGLIRVVRRFQGGKTLGDEGGNWVNIRQTELFHPRGATDFVSYDLTPGKSMIFMGADVTTNSLGFRDREYSFEKPPGTFRIAICGASNDMGYGVPAEASYPELLEAALNESWEGKAYEHYEVINLSVGGYQLLDRLWVADTIAPQFNADLILIVVTMHDLKFAVHQAVARTLSERRDLHFDFLKDIAADANAHPGDSFQKLKQRFHRQRGKIVSGAFEELVRVGQREGTGVGAVMLDLRVGPFDPDNETQASLAEQAGLPVLRVFDTYRQGTSETMYLTQTDPHPSVEAHGLLADELLSDMMGSPAIGGLLRGGAN